MSDERKKIRVTTFKEMKRDGRKITVVTAHDALSATIVEAAGIDIILVGDSLGMTSLGFETTIPVTMEMMLHHCAAVARGAKLPLLVGDMPFMTYKISREQALANAARFIQEANMEAVKVEGGVETAPVVERIVSAGIPVMGHIGLLPQSFHAQGGFRVQGRNQGDKDRLLADARALESAGAFMIVLEAIPVSIAREITKTLSIPTIGIGAGADCDGQVLVFSDIIGMAPGRLPKLARKYADVHGIAIKAIQDFADEIRKGAFPGPENIYSE
jgi:3-methyl-2-oxobutanoate hydroxymethyltransferase